MVEISSGPSVERRRVGFCAGRVWGTSWLPAWLAWTLNFIFSSLSLGCPDEHRGQAQPSCWARPHPVPNAMPTPTPPLPYNLLSWQPPVRVGRPQGQEGVPQRRGYVLAGRGRPTSVPHDPERPVCPRPRLLPSRADTALPAHAPRVLLQGGQKRGRHTCRGLQGSLMA